MAPIFASPDIAALVAAFPPPLPTRDRPSLVKSHPGTNLLDSRKVVAKFRVFLETSAGRIKKSDLPSRLGVESTDWLFDCYDGELCHSNDLQSLISRQEAEALLVRLRSHARAQFVDLAEFAATTDVSRQSLDQLLGAEAGICRFSVSGGRQLVADQARVDHVKEDILRVVEAAGDDRVELVTRMSSSIPPQLLFELAEQMRNDLAGGGRLFWEGEKVMFEPKDYQLLRDKKRDERLHARVAAALEGLESNGWCEIRNEAADEDGETSAKAFEAVVERVTAEFAKQHGDSELRTLQQNDPVTTSTSALVAKASVVDAAMDEMATIIQQTAESNGRGTDTTVSLDALQDSLCAGTEHPALSMCLLQSNEHRKALEAILTSALASIQGAKAQRFTSLCQKMLLAPLELYNQGLQTVSDETLRQRLDGYICEHFRNEIIPDIVRTMANAGLLQDKGRSRDLDKFNAVCAQAKRVGHVQSACSKLCRKQKIEVPGADILINVKQEALRDKLKSVKRMSRASDILQNVVWILLAQRNNGLFLSAGKDTSRVIKYYQSIGDAETGRQIEQWRDAIKAGKQTDDVVQDMKAMADVVVESL